MEERFWAKRKRNNLLFVGLLVVITYAAMVITQFDVGKSFTSIPKAIVWGTANFYPDLTSLEKLPNILGKLLETILMSIAATMIAAILAIMFAIFGSETTQLNAFFGAVSRFTATLFRNVDVAAWALILLFSFGQSVLTGYFALFFVSFGFLTRAFIESIDEASKSSVEALRATGASYFSIIKQSVIPSSLPQMMSWILFMVETNIRSATLIGILTGTGIGFTFDLYYKSLHYHTASLVVVTIVIAILLLEFISNSIRRVIL